MIDLERYTEMVKETIDYLTSYDEEIGKAIASEYERQSDGIRAYRFREFCIGSRPAAAGTVLTNKYAEGYPGKRYYGGCQCVDVVENIARERAKQLFGAEHANVQPHSGSQANTAVYVALLQPGDTVMGMSLADGGHLTHGKPGKSFRSLLSLCFIRCR